MLEETAWGRKGEGEGEEGMCARTRVHMRACTHTLMHAHMKCKNEEMVRE